MSRQINPQTPIRSWRKLQLSLFSKGFLYSASSGVHLFTFMVYFLILSKYLSPFGYYNPTFWFSFYVFYTFVAIGLFYHGTRILFRFYKSLPSTIEEYDNTGFETDRIDRT